MKNLRTKLVPHSGFTLLELLIVMVIIGILATIAIAFYRNQIFKANDARRKADLDRIKTAVEEYEKDHNCYPLPSLMTCNPGTGLVPYLDKIPCDPVTHASYFYEYEDSVCPGWYRVYTVLEQNDPDALPACLDGFNYYVASANAPACLSAGGISGGGGSGGVSGGGGSGTSTPPPGAFGNYYGCMSGVCSPINWDSNRPGPECDPNYQNSSCYNQCSNPSNECVPWH